MSYQLHDLAGILGVTLIILSYLALQLDRLSSRSLAYSVTNALGAALILFSLGFAFNLSAFVVEFFWLAISLLGIVRSLHRQNRIM